MFSQFTKIIELLLQRDVQTPESEAIIGRKNKSETSKKFQVTTMDGFESHPGSGFIDLGQWAIKDAGDKAKRQLEKDIERISSR